MSDTLVHPWKIDPRTGLALRAVFMRPPRRGEVGEQPVWPIMGASEDDPGDDDDEDDGVPDPDELDDEDDDDEDDDEDDPWAGKSEADLKAELRRLSGAHGKAKTQAQRWREFAQGKTDTAPDGTKRTAPKPAPKTDPKTKSGALTRADLEAAVEEARNEARAETREATIRTTARAELRAAGLSLPSDPEESKAVIARAVRLLDLDDVSVEDGEVVGLDDAIADLKRMLPGMFKAGSPNGNGGRRKAPNPGNTGGGKGGAGKPKTATEQQAALIFGGS